MTELFHYTCDHGRAALGYNGLVLPALMLAPDSPELRHLPTARFSWFTDLTRPQREALGLTSNFAACDRTAYRYRVDLTGSTMGGLLIRWVSEGRKLMEPEWVRELEESPGARPMHWWVGLVGIPVTYDPI